MIFSSTGFNYLLVTILLLPIFYLSCLLETIIIFLEVYPCMFKLLAVWLLDLRQFFSDLQRILRVAEEHLDLIDFYSPEPSSA
jgi:hypothetical protein